MLSCLGRVGNTLSKKGWHMNDRGRECFHHRAVSTGPYCRKNQQKDRRASRRGRCSHPSSRSHPSSKRQALFCPATATLCKSGRFELVRVWIQEESTGIGVPLQTPRRRVRRRVPASHAKEWRHFCITRSKIICTSCNTGRRTPQWNRQRNNDSGERSSALLGANRKTRVSLVARLQSCGIATVCSSGSSARSRLTVGISSTGTDCRLLFRHIHGRILFGCMEKVGTSRQRRKTRQSLHPHGFFRLSDRLSVCVFELVR